MLWNRSSVEFWHFVLAVVVGGLIVGWLLPRHVGVLALAALGAVVAFWLYQYQHDTCRTDPGECYDDYAGAFLFLYLVIWAAGSACAWVGAKLRRTRARSAT